MFAALLLSAAAQEMPAPAPQPTPTVAAKPKKERRICRPIVNSTSRMNPQSECRTAAEWRALGEDLDTQGLDRARGR